MKIFEITFCGTWILCVCLGQTFGAPASWDSPCGSHSIRKRALNTFSLTTIYESLIQNAELFTRAATKLKTLYTPPEGSRVTGDRRIQELQSIDIPGLNQPQNITNKTSNFLRDYENLSRLGIYLDCVLEDENNTNYGQSGEYAKSMKKMIGYNRNILCDLHKVIQDVLNSTTVPFTSKDVMPEECKSIENRSLRFQRDYVIIHQAENFGKLLKQQYMRLYFLSA